MADNEPRGVTRRDFIKLSALTLGELALLGFKRHEGETLKTKPTIEFQENYGLLLPEQKKSITEGVKDSLAFWRSLGAKGPDTVNNYPFVVMTYTNNETSFFDGKFLIKLGSHDKTTAAHEAFHTFGLRINGLPGFMEAPAVATQMKLYGGSVNSNTAPVVANFRREGKNFADYSNGAAAMIVNYNKSGVAALEIGLDFWVAMNNKYFDWVINQPSQPFCTAVSTGEFHKWVDEFRPGFWGELGVKYPVLFSK